MPDYYLQDRSRLQGQPKRTIADYVESQGILVPRRFDSLKEARASGRPILVRSEHEQEYDGVSGLLNSPKLDEYPNVTGEEDLHEKILAEPERGTGLLRQYCRLLGLDEEQFKREASFSFWEYLSGYNRTVVADSSIKGRYHVMTMSREKNDFVNYCIAENGKIIIQYFHQLTANLVEDLPTLIDFYNSVQNLSHFDHVHCPIIEIQTEQRKNYFLQYHRARDFKESNFVLERPKNNGEIEAKFVRGATSPEGFNCQLTVRYGWWESGEFPLTVPKNEEGSLDLHWNYFIPEFLSRKRRLQIIYDRGDLSLEFVKIVLNHTQRSVVFKPEVSVIIQKDDLERLISETEMEQKGIEAEQTGQDQHLNIHLISDGRKAYLKRV